MLALSAGFLDVIKRIKGFCQSTITKHSEDYKLSLIELTEQKSVDKGECFIGNLNMCEGVMSSTSKPNNILDATIEVTPHSDSKQTYVQVCLTYKAGQCAIFWTTSEQLKASVLRTGRKWRRMNNRSDCCNTRKT